MTFDEALDTASAPTGAAFLLVVTKPDGTARTIRGQTTAVTISGKTVTVALRPPPVQPEERVTVDYDAPDTNPLQDAAGNDVADFDGEPVTNRTPPVFSRATVAPSRDYRALVTVHFRGPGFDLSPRPKKETRLPRAPRWAPGPSRWTACPTIPLECAAIRTR